MESPIPYEQEAGWIKLLEQVMARELSPTEVIASAQQRLVSTGDHHWRLPWAMALWTENRYADALALLSEVAVAKACDGTWIYHNLIGMVARQLTAERPRAVAAYERSLQLEPNRADTLYNFANLLKDDQPETAVDLYQRSLKIEPLAAAAWHNYGSALNNLHGYSQGLKALQASLQLDPAVADVWCNLGLAYFGLERFVAAERCFRHAIALDSNHAASHTNLGNALISVLQPEEALRYLERGVELDQSSTHSLWNLALAYLLLGDYARGWHYYEARFDNEDFEHVTIPTSGPRLRDLAQAPRGGEPPLVVWSEQGLGDAIQFARYLYLLDAAGIPFVFLARPVLMTLLRDWTGLGDRVQPLGSTTPALDARPHVALMSLPMIFSTELHTVPCSVPYLQPPRATPEPLKLVTPPGGLAIGLVWASNPDNKAMYRNKSMPLAPVMPLFRRLIDLDLIELHSLQFGVDAAQLDPWRDLKEVVDWQDRLKDFSDTAHVLQQLDLVITVDTAVAHLAGALNKPTWLLLPQNADFRWLRQRPDSPWYPSMRIFRQTSHGDWDSVVRQLEDAFDTMLLLDTKALAGSRLS